MKELSLKYGCNPHQLPARIYAPQGELPLEVLNGNPGYINFLDALNAWQLVQELAVATDLPAAASFKHVSPAGVGLGLPLSPALRQSYWVEQAELSPQAAAYARARGADRMSSFGDWIALSGICDASTARLIAPEVSDGIIAPGYEPDALAILMGKRKGNYNILAMDPDYQPPEIELKQVFGICFEQQRNRAVIDASLLANIVTVNKDLPESACRDLLVALITLKYTQSNSVCYAQAGQAIGVGAGQQSRIHCNRLAGDKADLWQLRQHPKVLALPFRADIPRAHRDNGVDRYLSPDQAGLLAEGQWQQLFRLKPEPLTAVEKQDFLAQVQGVALASDAFFPFDDNIRRARQSGVAYIAQPGGSIRDEEVIAACDRAGLVMCFTGLRLFHH